MYLPSYLPSMPHRLLLILVWVVSLGGVQVAVQAQDQLPDTVPNRLFRAVESRDLALVRALLAKGADPNAPNFLHTPPLVSMGTHWQNRPEELDIVSLLLAAHADPNLADSLGRTPLMELMFSEKMFSENERSHQEEIIKAIRVLLAAGADINRTSVSGATALSCAVQAWKDRVARFLIDNGADLGKDGGEKYTPLHYAACAGDTERVRALLKAGANVNASTIYGRTPLMLSAVGGSPDTVQALLEAGADVKAISQNREEALGIALENQHPEAALLLVHKGVNIKIPNRLGRPPLLEALLTSRQIEFGNEMTHAERQTLAHKQDELIQAILDAGADPNQSEKDSSTPLIAAIDRETALSSVEHVNWVPILLDRGADINRPTIQQELPLERAIYHHNNALVKLLLERGARARSADTSPLLQAIHSSDTAATSLLLEHGAELDCYDGAHKTPLMWAAYMGQREVVEQLLAKGATLEAKDLIGQTALTLARKANHPEIVAILLQHGAQDPPVFHPSRNTRGQAVLHIPIEWTHGVVSPDRLTIAQATMKQAKGWFTWPVPHLFLRQGSELAAQPVNFGHLWQDPNLYTPQERNDLFWKFGSFFADADPSWRARFDYTQDSYDFFGLITLNHRTYVGMRFRNQKMSFVFQVRVQGDTLELTLLARIPQIENEPHVVEHSQDDLRLSRSQTGALLLNRLEGKFILDANDRWRKLTSPPVKRQPRP